MERVAASPGCQELTVRSGEVELAGSWWQPTAPIATVVMHPGSGPSDRDNDTFFPPIRDRLLAAGIAVASFDKRGVGGSTGRWQDAGIDGQVDDVRAAVTHLVASDATPPIGLFGHSQGGWVVVEAAQPPTPAGFVITSSGPGVPPAEQDRFALERAADRAGRDPASTDRLLRAYDTMADLLRRGVAHSAAQAEMDALGVTGDELDPVARLADDPESWQAAGLILDHDPRPGLAAVEIPLLAVFGAADDIVPVGPSVAAFLSNVDPTLLTIAVLAGGDHRLQRGDPPVLVDGYTDLLTRFITRFSAGRARPRTKSDRARPAPSGKIAQWSKPPSRRRGG
jgi:pimeloyl-ACP methyl ester carboxylesterase